MVNKKTFSYLSRDGLHNCQAYVWQHSDIPVRAVVQIVHGMQEHMNRYNDFAAYLCEHGFLVTGNDHLGHGATAAADELGYFAKDNADVILVRDVHRLKKLIEKDYTGLPYFILGHSMGSFITRKYITMYGKGISGAIICATGFKPLIITGTGRFLSSVSGMFKKGRRPARFLSKVTFNRYNRRVNDSKDSNAWLVRNEEVLNSYNNDPLCGFEFTANGYHTLYSLIHYVDKKKHLSLIPNTLPIFIISGMEDPVGDYGRAPRILYNMYSDAGISDVSIKLYDNMRHEILNDIECMTVYEDISDWLNEKISSMK